MEITSTMLYLITRLDNIGLTSCIIMIMGIIGMIVGSILCVENGALGKQIFKRSTIVAIIFVLIMILTPTTKEMAVILVLPRIVNSDSIEQIQKDSGELYGLALEKLKEMWENDKVEEAGEGEVNKTEISKDE